MKLAKFLHSDAMYGINNHGTKWLVSIKRAGVTHARMFAFSTHGGKRQALAHAQSWRDAVLTAHPVITKREAAQKLGLNNTSGVPGVVRGKDKHGKLRRWVAQTRIAPGRILSKSFGITKHGYEQAKRMAIAERERQLQQMEGHIARHPAALAALAKPAVPYPPVHLPAKTPYSQHPGIRRTYGRNGEPQSWMARTMLDGRRVTESFSIAAHGDAGAKALAVAARNRQLIPVADLRNQFSATAPDPDLAVQSPGAGASRSAKRVSKKSTKTGI